MDDLCRIRLDKKLLNWHIPVPDRVIFQEYFKSLMDVCQKFLEGKACFFVQNYSYNFWMHWFKSIFNACCQFWQRLFIYVNSTDLIDSTVSCNKVVEQNLVWWHYYGLWSFWFGLFTLYSFDGMATRYACLQLYQTIRLNACTLNVSILSNLEKKVN